MRCGPPAGFACDDIYETACFQVLNFKLEIRKDAFVTGGNKAARVLVVLGATVLFASAATHSVAYLKVFSPAVGVSNLQATFQSAGRVAFLLMACDWIVIAVVALVATFGDARLRKALVLICGLAILAETALTAAFVGFFIGNELIGSAGLFLLVGGLLFERSYPPQPQPQRLPKTIEGQNPRPLRNPARTGQPPMA